MYVMSAVDKFIEAGLASKDLAKTLDDALRMPVSVAREIYPVLVGEDFNSANTSDQKQYLLKELQKHIQESKQDWREWINQPFEKDGKRFSKHSRVTLFEVIRRVSTSSRHESVDPQTEQVEQPTVPEESVNEYSETVEPPVHATPLPPLPKPNAPEPSIPEHPPTKAIRPKTKKPTRKQSHSESVQEARVAELEKPLLESRLPIARPVNLDSILRRVLAKN